jgi:hypothetical protein
MIALDRTEPTARQYAWLPPSLRTRRRLVTGGIWAATGALLAGGVALVPPMALSWKLLAALGVGGGILGERVGSVMVRRHVARLARGEVSLARVHEQAEGEVVYVRGRVRAAPELHGELQGLLHGVPGVYRRLVFRAGGTRWIHEAAVAFDVVDAHGEWIRVEPRGARLLAPVAELMDYPASAFTGARVTPSLAAVMAGRATGHTAGHTAGHTVDLAQAIPASELVVRDGDEVELVGHKSQTADVTGHGGSFREPPQRAVLRSGDVLPLLITPPAAAPA